MGRRGRNADPIEVRLWAKVEKGGPDECWLFNPYHGKYGRIRHNGRMMYAHRVAYELLVGPIPAGKEIDHTCHRGRCVNPKHMRVCSMEDNKRNMPRSTRNKSGFKGVDLHQGKWRARIKRDANTSIDLGRFDDPASAYQAYCAAAVKYHGDFANFGN